MIMNFLKMTSVCPRQCQNTLLKARAYCQTIGYRHVRKTPKLTLLLVGIVHTFLGILTMVFGIVGILIHTALAESMPIWTSVVFFVLGIYSMRISKRRTDPTFYKIGFIISLGSGLCAIGLIVVAVIAAFQQFQRGDVISEVRFTSPSPYGYPYVQTSDVTAGMISLITLSLIGLVELSNCLLLARICWRIMTARPARCSIATIIEHEQEQDEASTNGDDDDVTNGTSCDSSQSKCTVHREETCVISLSELERGDNSK